jgi:Fe-S-cluster containining protein
MKTCNGDCCEEWLLTPEDIVPTNTIPENEVQFIKDMLIFKEINSEGKKVYKCKHYMNRLCSVYETRPIICRNHGETLLTPCTTKTCTYKPKMRRITLCP